MLEVCEKFAIKNNLKYSSDPNPAKSKSKCMLMCGKTGNVRYPAPLLLNGQVLPWVECAAHLGHELSQSVNMERDAKIKRVQFIDKSTDIREILHLLILCRYCRQLASTVDTSMEQCCGTCLVLKPVKCLDHGTQL